jgi:hypothetical protein
MLQGASAEPVVVRFDRVPALCLRIHVARADQRTLMRVSCYKSALIGEAGPRAGLLAARCCAVRGEVFAAVTKTKYRG